MNKDPYLIQGAAESIGRDEFDSENPESSPYYWTGCPRAHVTMQVVDIALLKYDHVYPFCEEPCASFQKGESISLVDKNVDLDNALVRNLSRYRLQLSDRTHTVSARFFPENQEYCSSYARTREILDIHEHVMSGNI